MLNSRILWTFSAAYNQTREGKYLTLAKRAKQYIVDHFVDREFGGVFWSVDFHGHPLETRKQIYGIAFCIFGLTEFYKACGDPDSLNLAIELYRLIELHSFDRKHKGYFEAFGREWQSLDDLRLSPKDANEQKTMNTHLHVLEAYASLYQAWPNVALKEQIEKLLEVFAHHIVNSENHHLNLFFDERWNVKGHIVSYGHDIEAAWLLQQAAEVIDHPGWVVTMKSLAVKIADAAAEGLDEDGGLMYEQINGECTGEKHWWPQAEAMVGFYNAYQVSGNDQYLKQSVGCWKFVNRYLKDHRHGEWFWGINSDDSLIEGQDKAGFWKCPYHNGRACMELIARIEPVYNLFN